MLNGNALKNTERLITQFKWKGASVKITSPTYDIKPETWNAMQLAKNDIRLINSTLNKYGIKEFKYNPLRDNLRVVRSASRPHDRLNLYVSMNGHTRSGVIEEREMRRINMHLKSMRDRIIGDLRNTKRSKNDYDRPLQSYEQRAHYIVSNTNVNDILLTFGNREVGFVHAMPNQILKIAHKRKSKRMFEPVSPKTSERHVGIEIECGIKCSKEELAMKLLDLAGYVMVKGDGSVNVPNRNNLELNICAPVSMYKSVLKRVTDVLNSSEVSARVNKTCGLHIHLDVREYRTSMSRLNELYSKLVSVQPILYSMQPKSRQSNTYCVKSKSRSINRGASRYQGINAQAIWKYTTIETRLHAGTTDYTKIANWIDLLAGIMYSEAQPPKRALSSVRSMFRNFQSIPTNLMSYVNERISKFQDANAEENESSELAAA